MNEWFMETMAELEHDISERKRHVENLKSEITAENRMIKTMQMDLENKRYELRLAKKKLDKLYQ